MIYVVATLTIKPGSLDAVREAAAPCIAATRREKGCVAYDLHASLTDPHTLVFVERWETRDDLAAHSKQPHLLSWREASAPHTISRKVEIVHAQKVEQL